MSFLDQKTDGGLRKGKIAFYCSVLQVSRQAFCCFLKQRNAPWKYWNNRRICTANGGLPLMLMRQQYYDSSEQAA